MTIQLFLVISGYRLLSQTDPLQQVSYAYDSANNLLTLQVRQYVQYDPYDWNNISTAYQYDDAGNLLTQIEGYNKSESSTNKLCL